MLYFIAPPLYGLIPLHFIKNLGKPTGCSSPLEGERANDCNFVAHREPWGVEKSTSSKGLSILQKLQQKDFQRIEFLDFKFNPQIYKFF
jgi:hypothetical protein